MSFVPDGGTENGYVSDMLKCFTKHENYGETLQVSFDL